MFRQSRNHMTIFREICLFSFFFFSGFNYNGTKLGDFTRNFNEMFRTCGRIFVKIQAIVFHKVCPSFSFSFIRERKFLDFSPIFIYRILIITLQYIWCVSFTIFYTFHSTYYMCHSFNLAFYSI